MKCRTDYTVRYYTREHEDVMENTTFLCDMMNAEIILSDSGDTKEEMPLHGKPVPLMRDTTESIEAVIAGTVKIVGTSAEMIKENTHALLTNKVEYDNLSQVVSSHGDGKSVGRIVDALRVV